MDTLRTIQKLSKTGQVLSRIIFVCSLAGICISIIGILFVISGIQIPIINLMTLEFFLFTKPKINVSSLYASMTAMMIFCIKEAVLARNAEMYFIHELKEGTPFSVRGAMSMRRLGILAVTIPVLSQILIEITYCVLEKKITGGMPFQINCEGSLFLGIVFILLSLIFRYGAEVMNGSRS